MSLVDKKVTSKLVQKKLKGESILILTDNIIEQIDYLHKIVGSVEWSGVLVYKVNKGSIEDYKNLEVEVLEILPMDVGTSGYTEYELDSGDDYTFNNLCDRVMMDPDLKIGHIHTHHGMDCFFSGTDTQELHDNAPNHNYYLSLIVNFKDFSKWCAKIALVGEERQTGTLSSKFKGTKGDMVENFMEIDNTKEVLYTIDMNITANKESEFKSRVIELNKNKGRVLDNRFGRGKHSHNLTGNVWGHNLTGRVSGGKSVTNDLNPKIQTTQNLFTDIEKKTLKPIDLSARNIAIFTNMLITMEPEPTGPLESNISILDSALSNGDPESAAQKNLYIEHVIDNFEALFEHHFDTTVDIVDSKSIELVESVVKQIILILSRYTEAFEFLNDIIDELNLNYVLDPAFSAWDKYNLE